MEVSVVSCLVALMSAMLCLHRTDALECPSCMYVTTEGDSSGIIKSILDSFQSSECGQDKITGPTQHVDTMTCREEKGKEAKCSFYKGVLTVTLPIVGTEIPLQTYQRGCFYSPRASMPTNHCHNRDDVREDETVLKQVLDRVVTGFSSLGVTKFVGQLCLCSDTFCKTFGTSGGVRQVEVLCPLLFLTQLLVYMLYRYSGYS